jgi:NSS family neurotransmitter:Na+ symporter
MSNGIDYWSGRTGFILATIGSAVGIGSVWKFPYGVGTNGGGSFVLFYLLGVGLIVVPLMLAEFAIGRNGRADAPGSIAAVAAAHKASPKWAAIGVLGAVTGFLVLSFYSVIAGWIIAYAVDAIVAGLPGYDPRDVQARFDGLLASPISMAAYHAVFMTATALIVARGIAHGIEAACKVLMPVLMALMIALAAYSIWEGDAAATVRFLFGFNPEKVTARAALDALGLGFFSIGVGFALMVTYAAYAGRQINLCEVAIVTVIGDTAVSLLSGFAVFPIVFANGLDPSSGPGLIFVTLPLGFARMPAGTLSAVAFYVLLLAAALASAISMLELVVAPLTRVGWSRAKAAAIAAAATWTLGLATVLSFNLWSEWHPLSMLPGLDEASWFEVLDHVTSNVMLPAGGFALSLFAGWVVSDKLLREELGIGRIPLAILRALLRYLVPVGIAGAVLAPTLI